MRQRRRPDNCQDEKKDLELVEEVNEDETEKKTARQPD